MLTVIVNYILIKISQDVVVPSVMSVCSEPCKIISTFQPPESSDFTRMSVYIVHTFLELIINEKSV